MPIEHGSETVNVVERLYDLRIWLEPSTKELNVRYEYAKGYEQPDGKFEIISREGFGMSSDHARWLLTRAISSAGFNGTATLAQLLTFLFDGVRSGSIPLPNRPAVQAFDATPGTVPTGGGTVTLSWQTSDATSFLVESDPPLPNLPTTSGGTVSIPANTTGSGVTYTFTLTASGHPAMTDAWDRVTVFQA